MARARTRDPASKRRRITQAALALFARDGFDAASTAAIARRASVSEGLVFHHFGSKERLLEACGEEAIEPLVEALAIDPSESRAIDYPAVIRETFDWVAAHADLGRIWAGGDVRVTTPLTRGVRAGLLVPFAEALEREQARGRVRAGDPRQLAGFQFAIMSEALLVYFRSDVRPAREPLIREVARILAAIAAPDRSFD